MTEDEIEAIMTTAERRHPGNEEILEAIKGLLGTHVADKHLNFDKEDIESLVEEHRELYDEVAPLARDTNVKVTLLVDDMYGAPHPTAADPDARDGGWVPVLRSMQSDGINVKRTWSAGQWLLIATVAASVIAACGSIVVAVIQG